MSAMIYQLSPPPDNLVVAKALAEQGLHVFPCQEDGATPKRPKPGVYWRQQSTTDFRKLEQWWERWPNAIPAIDIGKAGFVVIDADRHGGPDGVAAWQTLTSERGIDAPMVETPGGGQHYYFRQPDGEALGNKEGGLPTGINVRGSGGYVIAPGAVLPSGRRYELHGALDSAIAVPDWLVDIIRGERKGTEQVQNVTVIEPIRLQKQRDVPPPAYLQKAVGSELEKLSHAPKGSSNNILNEVAFALGTMVGSGWLSRGQAQGWVEQAAWGNDAIRRDGRAQMMATIRSGMESGMKSPRPMPEERDYDALAEQGAVIAAALLAHESEVEEIEAPQSEEEDELGDFPERLTFPGGLVGEMVDWITDTARYPNRPMAMATALSVLGTAMGREWCGPTDSSTVLYSLVLAPTGGGKDHAIDQAARLMTRAGMVDLIGPDDFQSANAMSNFVQRKPLSLCIMDEFGAFLARITHKNASSFSRDTSAFLRKMWSTKFKLWRSSEYAQRSSVSVWAPSFNVLGVSVPKEFYAALRGQDVSNGFFNRFFVISTEAQPQERTPLLSANDVPGGITQALTYAMTRGRLTDYKRSPDQEIIPTPVRWGIGGEDADVDLKEEIAIRISADEDARDFYVRTREMAIRIATIVGFGKDMRMPVVDRETMQWAGSVALWSTERMYRQFKEYAAETETQALAKEIKRHIRSAKGKRISHSDLLRKLDHRFKSGDVKGVIELLVAAGDVRMEQAEVRGKGRKAVFYRV